MKPSRLLPLCAAASLALTVAGCGSSDEGPKPPPDPIARPGHPVAPVGGRALAAARYRPAKFEWPGGVVVTAPRGGTVRAEYTLDNPCGDRPRGAAGSVRRDTVALVLRWPRTDQAQRSCPSDITPDGYRIEMDGIPPGSYTVGLYEAIEGQTAAALSHAMQVRVP
ncbi:MAG: hypothetical protein JO040_03490 [Gemmatimonadetes bacterium]|nr:hypothetical protein [Gemmatimonadota bacterium]